MTSNASISIISNHQLTENHRNSFNTVPPFLLPAVSQQWHQTLQQALIRRPNPWIPVRPFAHPPPPTTPFHRRAPSRPWHPTIRPTSTRGPDPWTPVPPLPHLPPPPPRTPFTPGLTKPNCGRHLVSLSTNSNFRKSSTKESSRSRKPTTVRSSRRSRTHYGGGREPKPSARSRFENGSSSAHSDVVHEPATFDQLGRRVDPRLYTTQPLINLVSTWRPCNNHCLLGKYLYKRGHHSHNRQLSKDQLNTFAFLGRSLVCRNGPACDDPTYYAGYTCARQTCDGQQCGFARDRHLDGTIKPPQIVNPFNTTTTQDIAVKTLHLRLTHSL